LTRAKKLYQRPVFHALDGQHLELRGEDGTEVYAPPYPRFGAAESQVAGVVVYWVRPLTPEMRHQPSTQ
jgi:hypothetical protein